MGRFAGEIGSKLVDFILGFAELGYAWGTATVAISLVKISPCLRR